jgi:hypothetical protein
MKVYFGSYSKWWHPHNIMLPFKKILNISDEEYYGKILEPDGNSVLERFKNTWLGRKLHKRSFASKPIKYVKIDKWDTWNMDSTLAEIILPMLKQLKDTKHGSPLVDLEDVPVELHPTEEPNSTNGYIDNTHHQRWDWVINEMIFAFENKNKFWQEQFYEGKSEFESIPIRMVDGEPVEITDDEEPEFYEMKITHSDDYHFDKEGHDAYEKRISNGFLLFGKYYQALWD